MGVKLYSFKDGFKRERKKALYTQKTFTESYNSYCEKSEKNEYKTTLETVRNWEQGRTVPEWNTVIMICNFLNCDMDALFGNIACSTHDSDFICNETGLSEESVKHLKNAGIWRGKRIYKVLDIIIDNMEHKPEEGSKLCFLDLFANYLSFSGSNDIEYEIQPDGNIKISTPRIIEGKVFYKNTRNSFRPKQLEQMYIMEIEDELKAIKRSLRTDQNNN